MRDDAGVGANGTAGAGTCRAGVRNGRTPLGQHTVTMAHPASTHLQRWTLLVSAVTGTVVLAGGTAAWALERNIPTSNLRHWGDALWWSVATVTTTGYGEHYPVTVGGRVVAVVVMLCGMAILGAVAAIVAYRFTSQLTQRIEAAMTQVETEFEQPGPGPDGDEPAPTMPRLHRRPSTLRALTIGVRDAESAASLTWLLARLGWHPTADGTGLGWHQAGVRLRLAVRPGDVPAGFQGQLSFSAGTPQRLAQIAREALGHGFHAVGTVPDGTAADGATPGGATTGVEPSGATATGGTGPGVTVPNRATAALRTPNGFEVVLVAP